MNNFGHAVPAQRRILIADDNETILHLVTRVAEKEGYEVVKASNGREAYKILQVDSNFSVAIFDINMPHLQGTELVSHMQTEKRLMRIPVMMMTAQSNLLALSKSMAERAVVFLPKPFTTHQLRILLLMIDRNNSAPLLRDVA
jgi:two-component system chemotaxis sensor kinase CheA